MRKYSGIVNSKYWRIKSGLLRVSWDWHNWWGGNNGKLFTSLVSYEYIVCLGKVGGIKEKSNRLGSKNRENNSSSRYMLSMRKIWLPEGNIIKKEDRQKMRNNEWVPSGFCKLFLVKKTIIQLQNQILKTYSCLYFNSWNHLNRIIMFTI